MDESNSGSESSPDLWPMGAVTRRTGITEHTLRAWERRFGFPQPIRLHSGHRRYTSDQVRQLLLIKRALACGHRAGDVVPLSASRIEAMVRECEASAPGTETEAVRRRWVEDILRDALAFDEASIRQRMASEAATLGVGRFLRERAIPLIVDLGEAWARGDIGIRHEHLVSGILEYRLHAMRRPLDASTSGKPVVLACLPGELHGLGLLMVALEVAVAGRTTLVLGPETPVEEILATAQSLGAAAVALSLSAFSSPEGAEKGIRALRAGLPTATALWIGGSGAAVLDSLPEQVCVLATLDDVADAVQTLPQ